MNPDVVIVGGGPSGLLMACELALTGVRPVVLELLPEPTTAAKSNGLVGRVVQALDYRGLHERLSQGKTPPAPAPFFAFGALTLDMSGWDDNSLYTLPIPQRRLEELLEERALELDVEIRRGHEVTAISQDADGVNVDVRGPNGSYRIAARFLVGADGGHSTVRKEAGIEFPGITDHGFVTRDGQVTIDPPVAVPGTADLDVAEGVGRIKPGSFTRTETGVFAYGMFSPGVYRVVACEWDQPPAEESTTTPLAELRAAVGRVLGGDIPMSAAPGLPPVARTRTGVNSRLADRYRQGRIFLVGDAAHVQSGVGGPSLNLGLQDVLNLAWKLAAAINGWAPEGLLDTYDSERRPAGERVITQSRAQQALLSPGPNITALREVFTELLQDRSNVQHIANLMAGADICYDMRSAAAAHPMAGRWMPDLALDIDGKPARVADLMRTARPILLNLAGTDLAGTDLAGTDLAGTDLAGTDLADVADQWADRVDVINATSADRPADAILIRPDGYVAWASGPQEPHDPAALRDALATWFGRPAE
jgi:2-polyprenyl-6-methoxyphenol hydroxylase-like FAD-dependent oxidoreductase